MPRVVRKSSVSRTNNRTQATSFTTDDSSICRAEAVPNFNRNHQASLFGDPSAGNSVLI